MQIVPQRERRERRDEKRVKELNHAGDGRAEGTGRDVGKFISTLASAQLLLT